MPSPDVLDQLPASIVERAAELDRRDPLASLREEFVLPDGVVAYLDGNSLGRPLTVTRDRLPRFVEQEWGERLIRSWDDRWMDRPTVVGDAIGRVVLGASAGQTVVGDSTSVLLYKLVRAAVDARPDRTEIVADTENFPTDRFILTAVAAETGRTVRWIRPDPATGVQPSEVSAALGDRTALVVLSHVAYKSAFVADLPAITAAAHRAGALVLWDLCHSAGAVDVHLDAADVDLAVGCGYKFLNGGPGAPAFGYVAHRLQRELVQPIPGWMGHAEPFAMGPDYVPASGIRRFLSGTPSILGMLPLEDMLALIERAGMPAVRAKSVLLTGFTVAVADEVLASCGVTVASPRDPERRGAHVTLEHDAMRAVVARLWDRGVIPDFRPTRGLRVGLSPLSTSFTEVATALAHVRQILTDPDTPAG
ncbi:aminotransferase class V-fold PLP-dependent enzyme [Blastococcus saxobsidens]|uniref:Kynureninase n=1 Tax=Blastococcus saxobsidens TaxID=138336 RepID=A0A6L9W8S2_9ACTN|nr:aminotransferase class V-fold PLP-dependent enzyme [Blastococcus saxobsidens]NEK87891.1 aminotransferase class V-fold PLP-dependent enzyme [Blastococcus saxobsidens]